MSRSSSSEDAMKVDFENMRIEKNYHWPDVRRLSKESYVKQESKVLPNSGCGTKKKKVAVGSSME